MHVQSAGYDRGHLNPYLLSSILACATLHVGDACWSRKPSNELYMACSPGVSNWPYTLMQPTV